MLYRRPGGSPCPRQEGLPVPSAVRVLLAPDVSRLLMRWVGELCRSQHAGGGPMSGSEQLSCVGWLRARGAQSELGCGGGGHQLASHTV